MTRRSQRQRTAPGLHTIASPFADLSDAEVGELLREVGHHADAVFSQSLAALQQRILRLDPFSLLAMFSFYDLTSVTGWQSEWERPDLILQHQIETVQALCLRSDLDQFGFLPVVPPEFQAIRGVVRDATVAFAARRYKELTTELGTEDRHRKVAIERIRLDTQAIRNWGEADQVTRILFAVFEPLDEQFAQITGANATDFIQMWLNLLDLAEAGLSEHTGRLAEVMRPRRIRDMIAAYYRVFPNLEGGPEELQQYVAEQRLNRQQVVSILLSHSDLRLADIFRFDLPQIAEAFPKPVDPSVLQGYLETWSIGFGDLADETVEYFFLDNPIWDRPLIRYESDRYFWPIPGIFISFCFRIMERLMASHSDLRERYSQSQGGVLEEKTGRLFARAFPNATILRGSLWRPPGTADIYENDLLVQIDTHLLIVEAKGGGVAETARRGAEKRLKRVIEDLVVEPARQTQRFAEYLTTNPGVHEFSTRRGGVNKIDASRISSFIRLSVMLEPVGDLQTHWNSLVEAGLIDGDVPGAPTMLLADLETVFEYLDDVPQRLHYLKRRETFERNVRYAAADEIDLLGLYIETGFALSEDEFSGQPMWLYGLSEVVDGHRRRVRHGERDASKPVRKLTKWWGDILQVLEERQLEGWTDLAMTLLNIGFDEQVKLEKEVNRIKRIVRREWDVPGHIDSIIYTAPGAGLAIVMYKGDAVSPATRNDVITNAGSRVLERSGAVRAPVIGIDVDHDSTPPGYPYGVLAWVQSNGA